MSRSFPLLIAISVSLALSGIAGAKLPSQTYFYQNSMGDWRSIVLAIPPCPSGPFPNCFYLIDGTPRQMYDQAHLDFPYYRN